MLRRITAFLFCLLFLLTPGCSAMQTGQGSEKGPGVLPVEAAASQTAPSALSVSEPDASSVVAIPNASASGNLNQPSASYPPAVPPPTFAPPPVPTPSPAPVHIKLAFTGDLMVHDKQLESAYVSSTGEYIFPSFKRVSSYLMGADYTIGNLETTFAGEDAGYATYPLFNTPDSFADAMAEAGFDFVSTANNHGYDKRENGILRTLDILDGRGISHAGTYRSQEEQSRIFVTEINGLRAALLSYTYSTNGIPVPEDKPWLINMLDEELMREQISRARLEADIVIALPHMGNEYEEKAPPQFVDLAHRMCEWGADAVMANHPHVLQPAEFYKTADGRTCFIAYSMSNFVSSQRTVPRDTGAVFYLEFEKEHATSPRITKAYFAPTWVRFRNPSGRYEIEVLPIYDTLKAADTGENPVGLTNDDLARIRQTHGDVLRKMLGKTKDEAGMLPFYEIPKEF